MQIQVWISETGEEGLRDLGANLTYTRFVDSIEQNGSVQQINTNVHDLESSDFTVTLPVQDQTLFTAPMRPDQSSNLSDGLQAQEGVGLTFSMIQSNYGTIDGVFRAVERHTDLDLISKPELLVINGQPAEIHAGGEVPYQAIKYTPGTTQVQLNVLWQPIGVNMQLTPTILPNDMVQLNLTKLEVSDIARIDSIRGIDMPVFASRTQSGTVLVPNGQTLVIGGLSSRVVRRTERRVPVVGAVPLLGMPFRGRNSEADINHLLIFVSPTVVDLNKPSETTVSALDFWRREKWQHEKEINDEVTRLGDDL